MDTNKSRWAARHAAGQTKVDVAIATQAQAVASEFVEMKAEEAARNARVKANPVADLQAAAEKKATDATAKSLADVGKAPDSTAAADTTAPTDTTATDKPAA